MSAFKVGQMRAANAILMELENGIGRFSRTNVAKDIQRLATRVLDGKANIPSLFAQYAKFEEMGLVQGGPRQSKTASVDKRFFARALRLLMPAQPCARNL